MSISKIAISALALCMTLGSAASAAVFPSMPKSPHVTRAAHTHGASTGHSHKHK